MGKVLDLDELLPRLAEERSGKKVVFTNGCFDLIHPGHIDYLQKAKALGDILVVGVNDDDSVTRLKGPSRPVLPHDQRMRVVAALGGVDYVVGFSEDTPAELIARLKPDVHVKGGDYRADDLPEAAVVRSYGGQVVIVPLLGGFSTTEMLQKIAGKLCAGK